MLRHVKATAVRLWKDEGGASLLEYTILLALITAACVAAITGLGTQITTRWEALIALLTGTNV